MKKIAPAAKDIVQVGPVNGPITVHPDSWGRDVTRRAGNGLSACAGGGLVRLVLDCDSRISKFT